MVYKKEATTPPFLRFEGNKAVLNSNAGVPLLQSGTN